MTQDGAAVGPTEEQVHRVWQRISETIDPLMERGESEVLWVPHPGSSIAADDSRTIPYQCSHALNMALSASLDHLHALTSLLFRAGILHPYAPYTLARGALENAAIAFWLIHPDARRDRITHTLRWHAANIKDSVAGAAQAGAPTARTERERMRSLREVAERNSCPVDLSLTPMQPTPVLRYAGDYAPRRREEQRGVLGPLFAWQMCSGFSHGRPWSSLGVLEREEVERDSAGNLDVRQSNSLDRVLFPALTAFNIFEATSGIFDRRGRL